VFVRVDRNEAAGFSLRENQPSELKKLKKLVVSCIREEWLWRVNKQGVEGTLDSTRERERERRHTAEDGYGRLLRLRAQAQSIVVEEDGSVGGDGAAECTSGYP
jgi:hypothetical protein